MDLGSYTVSTDSMSAVDPDVMQYVSDFNAITSRIEARAKVKAARAAVKLELALELEASKVALAIAASDSSGSGSGIENSLDGNVEQVDGVELQLSTDINTDKDTDTDIDSNSKFVDIESKTISTLVSDSDIDSNDSDSDTYIDMDLYEQAKLIRSLPQPIPFTATPGEEVFPLKLSLPVWTRYLKFKFNEFQGREYYCTLTQVDGVYGIRCVCGVYAVCGMGCVWCKYNVIDAVDI